MKPKQTRPTGSPGFSIGCSGQCVSPAPWDTLRALAPVLVAFLSFLAAVQPVAGAQGNAAAAPPGSSGVDFREITVLSIHAKHMDWGTVETNLTLWRNQERFISEGHTVPEAVGLNLLAAMQRRPLDKIEPGNLGLTPEWVAANRTKLLTAFGGQETNAIFPRASARQRTWLTNALFDLDLLGEVVRSSVNTRWTDDYPQISIKFLVNEEAVAELASRAQHTFMVPWTVTWGTNRHTTYDAEISRAVANLLPSGFLHRERIQGNLLSLLTGRFENQPKVQTEMERMVLEESLGPDEDRFLREFELTRRRVSGGGSYGGFPNTWMAVLHRTNWPARLQMPVQTRIEQGVVPLLRRWLDSADARVQPILRNPWLVGLVQGEGKNSIQVAPEGSPADDGIMRGHAAKVGLAAFYDEQQPRMRQGLFFTFRDSTGRRTRTSGWFVLPDGKLLLVRFDGDGVLDWTPDELGFRGLERHLRDYSFNMVGVFLTADGQIEKVVPQTGMR